MPETPETKPQPLSARRRALYFGLRNLRALVIAYVVVLVGLMFFEEYLIFIPSRYPDGDWAPPTLKFEDAWFNAADGTKLHGWYVPHEKPRAVVLFTHGNAGNITDRQFIIKQLLNRYAVSVMIFDYRGYGRSDGKPSEKGLEQDARAARTWLAKRAGVAENEIVIMGESIGGGVAVDLAANGGARGLILENTFSTLPEVAASRFSWVPVNWLMRSRFDSVKKIKNYQGPLLQCHGTRDSIVPFALGQKLFAAANDPKEFVEIRNGDHNDPPTVAWYNALGRFFDQLAGPMKQTAVVAEGEPAAEESAQ